MREKSQVRFWITIVVVVLALLFLLYFAATSPHVATMQYDQFLAVMLTALGVVLAALALVVGVAAILGYQKISEIAAEEARKGAVSYLEQFLGGTKDPPQRLPTASANEIRTKESVFSTDTGVEPIDTADKKGVAQLYPRKEEKHGEDKR